MVKIVKFHIIITISYTGVLNESIRLHYNIAIKMFVHNVEWVCIYNNNNNMYLPNIGYNIGICVNIETVSLCFSSILVSGRNL